MAVRYSARIEGNLGALAPALRSLTLRARESIYPRALRRSAEAVRDQARSRYLSGSPLRRVTGELADSIEVQVEGYQRALVGSPLPQAPVLHFGWPAHNLPPRPYLYPAVEDVRERMGAIWLEEMERNVDAQLARHGRRSTTRGALA